MPLYVSSIQRNRRLAWGDIVAEMNTQPAEGTPVVVGSEHYPTKP